MKDLFNQAMDLERFGLFRQAADTYIEFREKEACSFRSHCSATRAANYCEAAEDAILEHKEAMQNAEIE